MANIFRSASLWLKIAMGAMALGVLLFVIGFSTVSWIKYPRIDTRHGLWKSYNCPLRGNCRTYSYNSDTLNDYHRAIQAMECLGLIFFCVATIVLLLYFLLDSCRKRTYLQGALIATFAGLGFAVIGFALFGSNDNTDNKLGFGGDIGWSMGIACAGGAAYGIAGIMLIIQLIK